MAAATFAAVITSNQWIQARQYVLSSYIRSVGRAKNRDHYVAQKLRAAAGGFCLSYKTTVDNDNPLTGPSAREALPSRVDTQEGPAMGLYCGIDLHSNNHVLTVIDETDRRVYERRLSSIPVN